MQNRSFTAPEQLVGISTFHRHSVAFVQDSTQATTADWNRQRYQQQECPKKCEDTMTHTAIGKFTVTSWDEKTVYQADDETIEMGGAHYPARGFTSATVEYAYTGDVAGRGVESSLISYNGEHAAPTLGFLAFEGSIDGHEGSVVLRATGEHAGMHVTGRLEIVEGLGTGGLANARGYAELEIAGHSDDGYPITFHYTLD